MRYFIIFCILFFTHLRGISQSTRSATSHAKTESVGKKKQKEEKIHTIKLKKRKFSRRDIRKARSGIFTYRNAIIKKNLKKRRKEHRKLRKNPKRIDPLYFGHRHLPNKSFKKRAYCKECHIVH